MDFYAVLDQAIDLLRSRRRVTYRVLKRQFTLDDELLEDLKEELIYGQRLAVDEEGRVLVWVGEGGTGAATMPVLPAASPAPGSPEPTGDPLSYTPPHLAAKILTSRSALEGERKQVTVLFCDWANSTTLAERLGPEAMHTLLNEFFALALGEVHRYEGTINQFLGDGFMALFGAPIAHEDHARRAILAATGIPTAPARWAYPARPSVRGRGGDPHGPQHRAGHCGRDWRQSAYGLYGDWRYHQCRRPPPTVGSAVAYRDLRGDLSSGGRLLLDAVPWGARPARQGRTHAGLGGHWQSKPSGPGWRWKPHGA